MKKLVALFMFVFVCGALVFAQNAQLTFSSTTNFSLVEEGFHPVKFQLSSGSNANVAGLLEYVHDNPKYFKVLYSEPLFVPMKGDDGNPYYTRDILYVYGMYDGEPMHFFINHWPSRRGGEEASAPNRALAASVAKHKIDSINAVDPTAKIVLMGDLNDDPVSPSVAKTLGATGNADKIKENGLYNPWVSYYKEGIGTLAYADAWNLFDQIMVSNAFMNKEQKGFFFQKANIFSKEFMIQKTGRYKGYPLRTYDFSVYQGGYSDHFPTYLLLLKEK